ncbi:hypothetical protein B9Z55_028348 [Caenorhabditis nigoni]|uniref:Uncharacterized protein n=1 Tax=Caenorhabditis nigoni TaxID=1611254 RepID=A0A2G5SC11_9PELO|nr:hypothetical protein B9Z55_028348 [Caenorhabditis nigoni]
MDTRRLFPRGHILGSVEIEETRDTRGNGKDVEDRRGAFFILYTYPPHTLQLFQRRLDRIDVFFPGGSSKNPKYAWVLKSPLYFSDYYLYSIIFLLYSLINEDFQISIFGGKLFEKSSSAQSMLLLFEGNGEEVQQNFVPAICEG